MNLTLQTVRRRTAKHLHPRTRSGLQLGGDRLRQPRQEELPFFYVGRTFCGSQGRHRRAALRRSEILRPRISVKQI